MTRQLAVLIVAGVIVALPFVVRDAPSNGAWREGDPVLTIISPHNEAIRYEFGRAFSEWHRQRFGKPVKVEWITVGGTTEISRYLVSEYVAAFRAWWTAQGNAWPAGAADELVAREPKRFPEMHRRFREVDDPRQFTSKLDLFFGGGEFDHTRAHQQGLTVAPWRPGEEPVELLAQIPAEVSGEVWRTPYMIGTCLSTFGICYNVDRLRALGVAEPPTRWEDLTDPVYFGQLGVADPTKSGSIAKAFEMIIQQQMREAADPASGWERGIRLIQLIGANARYFTDSASKVPIDVAAGDAAAGLAIDFYARFQAEVSGKGRMGYVTPRGGSSVSADPISLLRGAPNREVAVRFIEFVLSREGQRLWMAEPGTPRGPQKYRLCRTPIRLDLHAELPPMLEQPMELARTFTYRREWTSGHFNLQRDLVRAMCLDSGEELRRAWREIIRRGGPQAQPQAMACLQQLPVTWTTAREVVKQKNRLTYLREWTEFFRANYRQAERLARDAREVARAW
ncbi:MAG: ABC transporter substrate-binding protein [Verrucomicrobiae bacterium]|nr:ABC transporter substrate-binding protein [Verrucomicrobiae bacterium]